MVGQYVYYIESNMICLIIFAILFVHDLIGADRQEKQIKYDHALMGFMLYFVSDSIWALVQDGVIQNSRAVAIITNSANFILMASVTFLWMRYVMAVENVKNREKPLSKFLISLPFIISMVTCAVIFSIDSSLLINNKLEVTLLLNILMTVVPIIYIIAVLGFAINRAVKEDNPTERRRHYYVGFFPLVVVLGGILQLVFPFAPVFCFSCTILMIIYFIHSMDAQISIDPLTQLNNRGQFMRYTSQPSKLFIENRRTYIVMMDVNDFKGINDNHGHSSGDKALLIIADAMRYEIQKHDMPVFACRYGGDEFILIVNPSKESEVEKLINDIRSRIIVECEYQDVPYRISIGAGYDELIDGSKDSVQKCMQRADKKLYMDKESIKKAKMSQE